MTPEESLQWPVSALLTTSALDTRDSLRIGLDADWSARGEGCGGRLYNWGAEVGTERPRDREGWILASYLLSSAATNASKT